MHWVLIRMIYGVHTRNLPVYIEIEMRHFYSLDIVEYLK